MPRLTLDPLPYALLGILLNEGGMSFAAWFERFSQKHQSEPADVISAVQVLADYSFVDIKVIEKNEWLESLTPGDLKRQYGHLDAFNALQIVARGPSVDPLYFAASHLGIAEYSAPGYVERAELPPGASPDQLPPAEDLPTLSLD